MKTLLLILPYAGLVLSTMAAIWGLTHELSTKDENGKRRLTKAGKYSIAYILLGLLISFNTGVLKTITDNQDRNNAKSEAAQKEQQAALKDMAEKQMAEARQQELRDEARKTKAQIAEGNQEQRDAALAAQQLDLSLQQQQLAGFNEAEMHARQRTIAELQRSNRILFNINRGQYAIGSSIIFSVNLRISTNHPLLKKYAGQIQSRAQQMLDIAEQKKRTNPPEPGVDWMNWGLQAQLPKGVSVNGKGEVSPLISFLDRESSLIPQDDDTVKFFLENTNLDIFIVGRGQKINSESNPESDRDIRFSYLASVFRNNDEKFRGVLSYSTTNRAYQILGPSLDSHFISKGKLVSYLDLPGSTLLIQCRPFIGSGCNYVTIEQVLIFTPFGYILKIKEASFDHITIKGEDFIFHTFNPDVDSFFDRYKPF
jgi:hypothetical protein